MARMKLDLGMSGPSIQISSLCQHHTRLRPGCWQAPVSHSSTNRDERAALGKKSSPSLSNLCDFVQVYQPGDSVAKTPPANPGDIRDICSIPGLEDALEEEMATHSSILARKIPCTGEPGRLHGVAKESDMTEQLSTHTHTHQPRSPSIQSQPSSKPP